jgi:hypothetical protein
MKVLFYPVCHVTPHLETELELAQTHLEKGDSVNFLICKGELETCLNNPEHLKSLCFKCNSTVKNGIKLLKKNNNVLLLDYPKIDIDYSIIPDEFTDIEELKKFKIDDSIEIGLGAASSLISFHNREHKLNTKDFKSEISRELRTSYYLYKAFMLSIIPDVKPDLLYIFNGRFSTSWPIVSLCKKINIPFFTHDRGGKMGNYILAKNTIPHDFNYFNKEIEKVWANGDDSKYKIGSDFYLERRNKVVQGWYSFTTNQKKDYLPESFSKKRKNIAIFNSTIEEYAAIKGFEKFLHIFNDEIDALRSILTLFKDDVEKYFYLRVHPNLKGFINTQITDLYNLKNEFNNIEIIKPESNIDTYALLENSDIIIVLGSTVGIEAVYWGKPVIQLGLALYNNLNVVYIPNSINQLVEDINADLKPKEVLGAIKYGYWELIRGIQYKYFIQDDIFGGRFLNTRIQNSKLKYLFYRIIEIRSWAEIMRVIKRWLPKS